MAHRGSVWLTLAVLSTTTAVAHEPGKAQAPHGHGHHGPGPAGQARPYAGQDARTVKSLSEGEVQAYLEGHGMGLARPAELNHYPGPRHVLELSDALGLGPEQIAATRGVFDRMHAEAVRLGARYVEAERAVDAFFAAGGTDEPALRVLTDTAASALRDVRLSHLRAHLAMRELLTAGQIARYDALRGYAPAPEGQR
jgi:hypothetical protein